MIDGMYPSQFSSVQAMRNSHYRNMHRIQNSISKGMSWLSPDLIQVTHHKKANHDNWKYFTKKNQQKNLCVKNAKIFEKLTSICASNSRYACKTETSTPKDRLLHHNYLYECDRRYANIYKSNKKIAQKILNVKSQISAKKHQLQFRINKVNVHRLEKFNSLKRMNKLVSQSMREKFRLDELSSTSRTFKNIERQRYNKNPQEAQKLVQQF